MRSVRNIVFVMGLLVAAAIGSSAAMNAAGASTDIYSNIPTLGTTPTATSPNLITAPGANVSNYLLATSFEAEQSATPQSISMWISCLFGQTCSGTVELRASFGGQPSNLILGTANYVTSAASLGGNATCLNLTNPLSVAAGNDYWVSIDPAVGNISWYYQSDDSGPFATSGDNGATWSTGNTKQLSLKVSSAACGPKVTPNPAAGETIEMFAGRGATAFTTVSIQATGTTSPIITGASLSGPDAAGFSLWTVDPNNILLGGPYTTPRTLTVGTSSILYIHCPITPGLKQATLTLTTNDPGNANISWPLECQETPICPPDDIFEPNNNAEDAAELASGVAVSGKLCDAEDWYTIDANRGTLQVNLNFSHAYGDLNLEIYDPAGTQVNGSYTITDNEVDFHFATAPGTYGLRVIPFNDAKNVYTLSAIPGAFRALQVLDVPCPVYDSSQINDGTFAANETRTIDITGAVGLAEGVTPATCAPLTAADAVLSVQAINPQSVGNLRVAPAGQVANGGIVNYTTNGLDNLNTTFTAMSGAGQIDVTANAGATDVRVVVIGYRLSPPAQPTLPEVDYFPLTPCAALDTRTGTGTSEGPFATGTANTAIDVVDFIPAGQGVGGAGTLDCGVPSGAEAVIVNLVAIQSTGKGALYATEGGTNPGGGTTTPFAALPSNNSALAIVPINQAAGGTISVATLGDPAVTTHYRVVVLGYLDDADGLAYTEVVPCAAFDSRPGSNSSSIWAGKRLGGQTTPYQVTGVIPAAQGGRDTVASSCDVPVWAESVLINLVSIQPDVAGNLRASEGNVAAVGGVLNFAPHTPSMNNSNTVVVPVSDLGFIDVHVNTAPADLGNEATHVRGVVLGYFTPGV